ncbi:hypothetical protein V8E52_004062 [Russula decolorans]
MHYDRSHSQKSPSLATLAFIILHPQFFACSFTCESWGKRMVDRVDRDQRWHNFQTAMEVDDSKSELDTQSAPTRRTIRYSRRIVRASWILILPGLHLLSSWQNDDSAMTWHRVEDFSSPSD